jgi:hypothetical protein
MPDTGTVRGLLLVATTTVQNHLGGRPPLTDTPDFLARLTGVLHSLQTGDIATVAEAARRARCSRRSILWFREQWERGVAPADFAPRRP